MTRERDMLIELEDAKSVDEGDIETAVFVSRLPAKEWITTIDYALAAGVSEDTVRRYIEEGALACKSAGVCKGSVKVKYLIARTRAIQFFKSNSILDLNTKGKQK